MGMPRMNTFRSAEDDLLEIRRMMERSSKFLSLSGASGVSAGVIALAGAAVAYQKMLAAAEVPPGSDLVPFLAAEAVIVLALALASAAFFTTRMAKRQSLPLWNRASKLLLVSLSVPLAVGFVLCLIFLRQGHYGLIVPVMLLFYGMALLQASKHTLEELQYLAWGETVLGLIAAFLPGSGLLLWAAGFGLLHIVYGALMYFRYESAAGGRTRQE